MAGSIEAFTHGTYQDDGVGGTVVRKVCGGSHFISHLVVRLSKPSDFVFDVDVDGVAWQSGTR